MLLLAVQAGFLAVVLAVYSLVLVLIPPLQRFLPTLPDLVAAFGGLLIDSKFWGGLLTTLSAAGMALLISVVIGGAVGLLLSIHRNAYLSAQFIIDFMRTIPPLALIPLGLLLLGPTVRMEVSLIVISTVWLMLIQTYFAAANMDQALLETGRSYRMQLWRRLVFIMAPAIGPSFATAVRLSATLCLMVAIGTELLASGSGLGYLVGWYQQSAHIPETYAIIVVIGLLGVALNTLLMFIEKRLFAWHRREGKAA